MQTITTPAGIYTPPATALIQKVQLRIFESCPSATLCLMQYDRALPVIAVELFEGGNPYKVPENAAVNIRMVKPDKTTVYNPALGVSSDRKTTYIGITPQMTACFGSCAATLEIALNDGVLGTGLLRLNIEKNPVSEDAVESSDEYLSLQEIVNKVQTYADQASTAAESAEAAADLAMNSVQAVVSVNAQNFTKEQKSQARANIGAASTMDTYGTVKYTEQALTGEEKAQAVENIQAVSYRPGQKLGADGRASARQNIGAVSKAQALTAVEEKYFYEMGEPLVPETTVNCDLANSSGIYYSSISNKGAAIIEMKPETVVVVVNGEQHKLTVQYSHNPDGTVNSAYIGNRSFLGTGYADNGEDYLFSYSATTGSVAVMYSRTSGEKTFSIHVAGNVLADEYLNPLVIKAKPQALTAAMMQQARENIGAVGAKEAIEAVEDEFFEMGLSPIYPEETVPCVATAFNGGTVYKGTLSANGADFYNANYEKVYVKIGGETVKCSVEYWMGDPGAKYAEIGNKHLRLSSAADTGEDFCIDYRLANGPSVIYTRAAGDVTFTVNTPAPVMKQEYLPPMGAADAVTYTEQTLTDEQKAQARENIGAASTMDTYGTVKYTEQELTGEEKAQAVENIQAVSYRPGQNLGPDSRAAARMNIDAAQKNHASMTTDYGVADSLNFGHVRLHTAVSDKDAPGTAVTPRAVYDAINRMAVTLGEQELTEEQKQQARQNIDAAQTDHASEDKTYGVATGMKYGHVTLADAVYPQQTTGMAISPYGVYRGMQNNTVMLSAQTLTDEQKAQARENIGAAAVGEGGGEVGDITWDDIGVTHGDTLTWDGNTTGLPNAMGMVFKVSEAVPTVEDLQKGFSARTNLGDSMEFPAGDTEEIAVDGIIAMNVFFVVPPEMAGVESEAIGLAFPEAGTYFSVMDGIYLTELRINGYAGFPNKEKIPQNRLPGKKVFYYNFAGENDVYLYVDNACSVKATVNDIPEKLEFVIGTAVPTEGATMLWSAPTCCNTITGATIMGYNRIDFFVEDAPKVLYTAEYTGE